MKRIEMRKRSVMDWVVIVMLSCCILFFLGLYGYLNFAGFSRFCNPDVYADTQLAVRIWEQKTLFPADWQFGNQFYIASTPVLAALFYGLVGQPNLAMVLATECMTILLLAAFIWLLRAVTDDPVLQLSACLALLAANVAPYGPYSVNSMLFFMQSSFYSCYLITYFVVLGDYIRADSSGKTGSVSWGLSLVLSFAMGMQSLRQTVIMVLPVLACEMFRMMHRALLGKQVLKMQTVVRSISYAAANLAGAVVIKLLDVPNVSIYGQLEAASAESLPQRLEQVITALCEITSLSYVMDGECSRLLSLVIIGMIVLVVLGGILWLARLHRELRGLEIFWLLNVVGIFGVLLSTVVLNITLRGIYAFLWFPLVACSALMILERIRGFMRKGLVAVLCAVSLVGFWGSYGIYAAIVRENSTTDIAQISQWAVEQGYRYVYGDYWEGAAEIAVHSDGKLDAGCWHTAENVFRVEMANTPQDIYGEEENAQAIYVFTSADEAAGLKAAQDRGVTMTQVAQFGDYRAYVSSGVLMQAWE